MHSNELMRAMIENAINQRLKFKYILGDSWFSSIENIELIHKRNKCFIFDIKQNRLLVFRHSDKKKGNWKKISELDISNEQPVKVFLKGCEIELLLMKQVFINKDGSTGIRYLISNDLKLTKEDFKTIYKKRWSVEEYHKSLKQNNSIGKSPTRTIVTQSNHLFASLLSYAKMESYKLVFKINHFALKGKIYAEAIKTAFEEIRKLKKQMAEQ
jgi:transposase